jgi:23S rRNA (cytosine1962-C5)-methyltransferase
MHGNEWASPALCAAMAMRRTDAYRIATGPGGWVERLGDSALLSYTALPALSSLTGAFLEWRQKSAPDISRLHTRHVPRRPNERMPTTLAWGTAPPAGPHLVSEDGVRYEIELTSGFAYGLYPDQRENRRFLRNTGPRHVLNLFAYTCAFSVAAAWEGAETVSVDLSKRSLERGKGNFRLNGLDPGRHVFIAGDVLNVLPRLRRQGRTFDAIILDPPTFARGEDGKIFRVEKQLPGLIRLCLELLDTGPAWLLTSTNCGHLQRRDLESWVRQSLPSGRRLGKITQAPAPEDLPKENSPATVWAEVGSS